MPFSTQIARGRFSSAGGSQHGSLRRPDRSLAFAVGAGTNPGGNYSFQSANYAKLAGDLRLVRPRVLGVKSSAALETKEPRKYPFEFEGPRRETDTFDIVLPAGYEVDELPPPTDVDYSFASYHSKTESIGKTLHYARTLEVKELSVPVAKMDELKKFYRLIASDERNTAVLKPAGK
jgi:hypothetical protein